MNEEPTVTPSDERELELAFEPTTKSHNIYSGPWVPERDIDYAAAQKPVQSAAIPTNTTMGRKIATPIKDDDDFAVSSATIYQRTSQFKMDPNSFESCETVGKSLLKAREMLGLSIGEVEIASRIRASFITALERDDYVKLPQKVYVIAYIKSLLTLYRISKEDQELLTSKLKMIEGFENLTGNENPIGEMIYTATDDSSFKRIKLNKEEFRKQVKGVILVLFITLMICAILGGSILLIFKLVNENKKTSSLSNRPIRNETKIFNETDIKSIYSTIPIIKMNEISSE